MEPADRLRLFPDNTTVEKDSLCIRGQDISALAELHGTPLYLYDRATLDALVSRYRTALKAHFPGSSSLTYAGKAFLCKAVAQWARRQHLWLDCTGEAEIALAVAAGLQPESLVVHGANKSDADIRAAIRFAGTIVVDNEDELGRVLSSVRSGADSGHASPTKPQLWLRLQPAVEVETHHPHTETGGAGSKFGMTPPELTRAARLAQSQGLRALGLHFHLGSNFRETSPLVSAIELALDLANELGFSDGWHFSPGGGWGVAYHEDELPHPDIDTYVQAVGRTLVRRCRSIGLPLPELHLEPGRSLVARAGVAIYRVGAIKKRAARTWILTDGGMADNPRHALYGSRYSCLPVKSPARSLKEPVSIGGPHCESGDVLLENLRMPELEVGELIAIPVSGAYQLSMSSNYNGARRPAVLWLDRGAARLIVRRESVDDLLHRDLSIT